MKAEHWMQLIVGIVIFGTLAFLGTNVYDMRGLLSGMREKVNQTEQRVTRIADVLPRVQAQVAWEELYAPLSGFIAVSGPEEKASGEWISTVSLYDARLGEVHRYRISQPEQESELFRYVVAGRLRAEGSVHPSFHEMTTFASQEKISISLPNNIDSQASFVLRSEDMEAYSTFFEELADSKPHVEQWGRLSNWLEVAAELSGWSSGRAPYHSVVRQDSMSHTACSLHWEILEYQNRIASDVAG